MCQALENGYKAKIRELEAKLTPPDAPTSKGTITANELVDLLRGLFPDQKGAIHISDAEYEITTISELRRFVDWDTVNTYPYIPEGHDCDDFAVALAGSFAKYPGWSPFPVTQIWGDLYGGHAFCIAVAWPSLKDKTPTPYFLEPQNDQEIPSEVAEDMNLWLLPM